MADRGGRRWNPVGQLNPAWKGGPIANRQWFAEAYLDRKLSLRMVAAEAGCALRTAARWAALHGILVRSQAESIKLRDISGPRSGTWKGGRKCSCGAEKSQTSCKMCVKCWRNKQSIGGATCHNWKGLANVMQLLRSHLKAAWSFPVMIRDGFKCRRCGDDHGNNLAAHHIVPLRLLVQKARDGMPADTAEQRLKILRTLMCDEAILDLRNGATLCKKCHKSIHRGKFRNRYPL